MTNKIYWPTKAEVFQYALFLAAMATLLIVVYLLGVAGGAV
jgi:preprotein translocase subunit SecE